MCMCIYVYTCPEVYGLLAGATSPGLWRRQVKQAKQDFLYSKGFNCIVNYFLLL